MVAPARLVPTTVTVPERIHRAAQRVGQVDVPGALCIRRRLVKGIGADLHGHAVEEAVSTDGVGGGRSWYRCSSLALLTRRCGGLLDPAGGVAEPDGVERLGPLLDFGAVGWGHIARLVCVLDVADGPGEPLRGRP